MALSPMMQQYKKIKEDHKDCLLFFRLGDFYELFFDDAVTASRELELTLTGKSCGLPERAPMCGVPHHAADIYIAKLVEKGYKVAVCEQMEDPSTAKGIVERDVIRIVTPGTLDITGSAKSDENVYIAAVYATRKTIAVSYADITTGELFATDMDYDSSLDDLISELTKISPKEIILTQSLCDTLKEALAERQVFSFLNVIDDSYFSEKTCRNAIETHFELTSLMPLDIDDRAEIISTVGALLLYLLDTQKQDPSQIKELTLKNSDDHMMLDRSTMKNLELLETMYDKSTKGSLLGVLDKTKTAMGGRLLKKVLKEPLKNPVMINKRLDAVEALCNDAITRNEIASALRKIYDFERLTARVASMRANGKDLIALKSTLGALPEVTNALSQLKADLLDDIRVDISDFSGLYKLIDDAITEEPPFTITEGQLIKDGYSSDLDILKDSIKSAKLWIAELETTEKKRTGIKTLKVGFNKVFGYYIDVSKSNISLVPNDYIRKQTLVNNERYITPELKEKEGLVLSAEAKINAMEYEIFKSIRNAVEPYIKALQKASSGIALLDVLVSLADVAVSNGYVKPTVNDSDVIVIKKGRHPSVELMIGAGMFVSNDTVLDLNDRSMLVITGPNMSGKSTYMRQTAIIVLMAQIGSFVPCESAEIGVVDRVFTRIGASDNLSYGQSTFYIEMSELSNILRNATNRSLIVLDEIGRGTSTFDGLSIAWATIEYLCKKGNAKRTMFATHYHELTALADRHDNIHNLSVAVSESGSDVVFLHKIVEGPASKSYGIHVAKIAGVPVEIRKNAQQKLRELESNEHAEKLGSAQISFFDNTETHDDPYADTINKIRQLDLNDMTPLTAMLTLKDIQDAVIDTEEDDV